MTATSTTRYYPLFLDLRGRVCIAVGGSQLMEDKIRGLLRAGASVRVIAENLTSELQRLAREGVIDHARRNYRPGDLEDAALVISDGGQPATNEILRFEAQTRNIPTNVIDEPSSSSFISPAVVSRGDLCVAISTSGKAPALAVRLRQHLEDYLGPQYSDFLHLAGQLRPLLASRHPDFEKRKAIWYELVDSEILELLRAGHHQRANNRVAEIVGFQLEPVP